MADKQTIKVPELKAVGPYSHAVRAAGLLFVPASQGLTLPQGPPPDQRLPLRPGKPSRISTLCFGRQAAAWNLW